MSAAHDRQEPEAPGLLQRLYATHAWRAWDGNGRRRGPVLASGMAYAGLFSVFGALATGFTVFTAFLGSNTDLYDSVVEAVDSALPGLLDVGADGGAVDPQDLVQSDALSWAGVIAFVVTLVAALGWLNGAREGIRAMFDLPTLPGFVGLKKLRDLGVLATLGVVVLASAVLSLLVGTAASWLLERVGLGDGAASEVVLRVLSVLVVLVVDALIFVVLFRLMSGLTLPWADLRGGVVIGAVGLGVLKQLAGLLLGSAGNGNPLLATGAVVVGLLVWLNLVSRLTLLAASWVATTIHQPVTEVSLSKGVTPATRHAVSDRSGLAVELGPRPSTMPSFGPRSADRTAVAAGVVLGGLGAAFARVAISGVATAVRSLRGR